MEHTETGLIEKAVGALRDRDYKAFAACFSADGRYFDYCPSSNGGADWFVYGREAIEMFFRSKFNYEQLLVFDPVALNGTKANFFGAYDGPLLYGMFEIAALDDDGLILKAIVHPTA